MKTLSPYDTNKIGYTNFASTGPKRVIGVSTMTNISGVRISVPRQKLSQNQIFSLHLESSVLADEFEFGFMESVEAQFEEVLVTEAEGAGE